MNTRTARTVCILTCISIAATGCATAARHREAIADPEESRLTVAAAQAGLQVNMSGAEVVDLLGSPNIVSTDEDRNEVWVYDRVATEYVHSSSGTGLLSILGAASGVAGGVLPSVETRSGATRRSQRTLTVVVRFDADRRVRDFSYHASRF